MTQQTLREESILKIVDEMRCECRTEEQTAQVIADFFLAHFKEFAEKELIKEDESHKTQDGMHPYGCEGCIKADARNALRNEQREILAEKFK